MTEKNGKTIDWILKTVFTIMLLINAILIYPLRAELNKMSENIAIVERVELPRINRDISEIQAQIRERMVRQEHLDKSLDEIKAHLEHIRRRLGE